MTDKNINKWAYDRFYINEILDNLMESGTLNMFGAPRFLQENYNLTKREARQIFSDWSKAQ